MLFLYKGHINDFRIEQLFTYSKPKVLGTYGLDFIYRRKFNSELLTIFITKAILDQQLFKTTADILHHSRQTRILVIAVNIPHPEEFKQDFLRACENFKITNALLLFVQQNEEELLQLNALRPYPKYHWLSKTMANLKGALYYPLHWQNMQNASLLTYTSQDPPGALLYYDKKGNLKINGYVARLILLFAEKFNASLEMYKPLELNGIFTHYALNTMTNAGQLDIPIALNPTTTEDDMVHHSAYYELTTGHTIIPCATHLTVREVFGLLLNEYFFGSILLSALLLSILHSFIDYYIDGIVHRLNFVLNHKILPGILGQSFITRMTSWRCLKIVYLLVSFAGLNICTQFAANMNTLLTSPPYHGQIKTIEDLRNSSVKILCPEDGMDRDYFLPLFGNSLVISKNATMVYEHMIRFNNTYGYLTLSANWDLFVQRQRHYRHKKFCLVSDFSFIDFLPHCVTLPAHSPLKEPLDYLLYRINELGFRQAWKSSVFYDMVRLKNISLFDENPPVDKRVLRVDDLFWIWMIVVVGLTASSLVFLAELLMSHCRPKNDRV
ncbi:uncharacterized protein LOC131996234 [Stomoxys calcitrans]|uniref:uncharacterized protein LOC131996234 n=1 Tax=Stomoxys calcitrans TaxID=35570 RepID=UPI0027E2B703|nr:uncharacterized protein LOC131996234 [Stomoxys calcitrans]